MVKLILVGGSGATYPFLPQLPFVQLEYKWEETGTPSSADLQLYLLFLSSTMFCKTELFNTTRRCHNRGKYLHTFCKS